MSWWMWLSKRKRDKVAKSLKRHEDMGSTAYTEGWPYKGFQTGYQLKGVGRKFMWLHKQICCFKVIGCDEWNQVSLEERCLFSSAFDLQAGLASLIFNCLFNLYVSFYCGLLLGRFSFEIPITPILRSNIKTRALSGEQLAVFHLLGYNYFVFIHNSSRGWWCRTPFLQAFRFQKRISFVSANINSDGLASFLWIACS